MVEHIKQRLRWDIYETHLDEAAFHWSQWEAALDAPDFTLADAAELEERFAAHLDGLILGGAPVARRLLEPALAADEPERIVTAALALLLGEEAPGTAPVLAALLQAEPPTLAGLRRAFELAPSSAIPAALPSLLEKGDAAPGLWALVLDTLGAHGLVTAALCRPFLSHPDPVVAAAALRAAGRTRLPLEPALLQHALTSKVPALRDAALLAGLMGGHPGAWAACKAAADSRTPGSQLPLLLLGLGGDERDLKQLLELLSEEKLRADVLWALGFSGRVAAADACVALMREKPVAPLAGESFSAITGLRIEGLHATAKEEQEEAEGDDLDADLTPKPEDALPMPHPEQVAAWWKEARAGLDSKQRYLAGQPFTPQVLLDALVSAPMRRRHALALELALRSRGTLQVPTRAFVEHQLSAWKAVRTAPATSFSQPFAEGLRG